VPSPWMPPSGRSPWLSACDLPVPWGRPIVRVVDDFHPDLRRVARWLPRAAVSPRTLKPIRLLSGLPAKMPTKAVEVKAVAAISVRVHRPAPSEHPLPALLWIHGGGYVIGTAAQDDALCRRFAQELGIIVVAVDYRLAPEQQFPVPLHDCYGALAWLAHQPDVDSTRIAVGGASAGGGLAAALALLARERGEVQVAFQLLAYPMLDDRTATRLDVDERNLRLWNTKANRFGWQSYLGHPLGCTEVSGLAAPARFDDLGHVSPAWIGVGTLDLFYEEDVAYADRLRAAGVECQLDVVEGAFHGFDLVQPKAGVSQEFRSAQVAALAAALS
jgi:acetyl esterase/lipase